MEDYAIDPEMLAEAQQELADDFGIGVVEVVESAADRAAREAAALREATEWEAEVYRLRGVVEELERGRLEEDEEFSRLAKALTEMQDGIQEERREREWKEEEWERERASMSAQVSSVKGVLLVELQVASSKDNSG